MMILRVRNLVFAFLVIDPSLPPSKAEIVVPNLAAAKPPSSCFPRKALPSRAQLWFFYNSIISVRTSRRYLYSPNYYPNYYQNFGWTFWPLPKCPPRNVQESSLRKWVKILLPQIWIVGLKPTTNCLRVEEIEEIEEWLEDIESHKRRRLSSFVRPSPTFPIARSHSPTDNLRGPHRAAKYTQQNASRKWLANILL